MSLPAIEVTGLSKRYVIEHESRHDSLRDTLHHTARKLWRRFRWGTGFETEEFWALRDIGFSVQPGDVIGIVGRNGAGKSTLLKILSRITEPTAGSVRLRGRVASLLEVGTGFHPDLTGRENIFLNGAILGMSRAEIRRKFDEIVAFAEIERFLDTPVKRYSSGMYVRLAFAVAAHLEPEILIVDEVLAVGDAEFQDKCLGKMESIARQDARTVLFVSHNMAAVSRFCRRTILLEQGRLAFDGPTDEAVHRYLTNRRSGGGHGDMISPSGREHSSPLVLKSLALNAGGAVHHRDRLVAELRFVVEQPVESVGFGIGFCTLDGRRVITVESDYERSFFRFDRPGEHAVRLELPCLDLTPGRYRIDVGAFGGTHKGFHYAPDCAGIEVQPGRATPPHLHHAGGEFRPSGRWSLATE